MNFTESNNKGCYWYAKVAFDILYFYILNAKKNAKDVTWLLIEIRSFMSGGIHHLRDLPELLSTFGLVAVPKSAIDDDFDLPGEIFEWNRFIFI